MFFGGILLLFSILLGVYRATLHSDSIRQFFLASKAYLFSFLSTLTILYIFETDIFPKKFTILFFLIIPFIFILNRLLLNVFVRLMQRIGIGIHNVLIAGYDNGGLSIVKRFTSFPELGYSIKGIITNQAQKGLSPVEIHGFSVPKFNVQELERIIIDKSIDRVFVPSTDVISNGYTDVINICRKRSVKLKVLSGESEKLLRYTHTSDIAGITLYSPPRKKIESLKRAVKRTFDILFASFIIIIISPVLILTALAIFIESGKPIFFKQKRAALKGGRTFYFYKFRSMVKNADEMKDSLFDLNESDGALFKIKDDPRLTKVGKFIRRYSIDELPQLINVLKGDMSTVGPRPLPISDFEKLKESKEYWKSISDREKVKPGMTGLWQISGRSKIGFREMILLDLYYVENQSLLFDLEILFATLPIVFFGKGAY